MLTILLRIATCIINKINSKYHGHWIEKGIRYVRPWPLLGVMFGQIFQFKTYLAVIQEICEAFPEQRFFGYYRYLSPILVVRDPNLIHSICKNHGTSSEEKNTNSKPIQDFLSIKGLTVSSEKEQNEFRLMKRISEQCVTHYLLLDEVSIEVDTIKLTSKIANDILASILLGKELNSFGNPNNEFYLANEKFLNSQKYYFINNPKFSNYGIYNFCKNVLKKRRLDPLLTQKMIRTLQEQSNNSEETNEDITVQDLLYFCYKYQAISISMCYLIYELAINQNVQNKLRKEIDNSKEIHGSQITYEVLNDVTYLDMVILEHLRKRPFITIDETELRTVLRIEAEKVWEKPVTLDVGTSVLFPILAIHHDPKNYHQPDKFEPERFSNENRTEIKPFTYFPFGIPSSHTDHTNIITEMKTFIFYLLSSFVITATETNKICKKGVDLTVDEISKVLLKLRI